MKSSTQASLPVVLREPVPVVRPEPAQLAKILDPFIPAPAVDGARIYDANWNVPLVLWLCDPCAEALRAKGWTLKLSSEPGALQPPFCDVHETNRQREAA